MIFKNPYWDVKTKIELLSKWIIVHSIIYYTLDANIVTDNMFDANSLQLVYLVDKHKREFKDSKWYYVLKDFDGSTGFDLYGKLNKKDRKELMHVAQYLVRTFGRR